MKILNFLITLLIVSNVFSQKVKIKKGEVFLNKEKIAKILKIKENGHKYFQVSDINNQNFCKIRQIDKESLLFHKDKIYPYRIFYGDKFTDTIAITEKNYWLSDKRIIQYMLKIDLIDSKGLKAENIDHLVKNTPKIPTWISTKLDKEKETLKNIDFKIKRLANDTLILKTKYSKDDYSLLNKSLVRKTRVDIFQKDQSSEIYIGYAIHQLQTTVGVETHYYFIFNTKDVPLSSFDGSVYKSYKPFVEYGITKNKLNKIKNRHQIIETMAKDLISEEKL
ncbi:hypothetical protein [Aquimarina agarivorans]|uniref:hypothetical protein n=1 Tax=Aquimarina agarivorans TaxID=980584 RepID=UPI000248F90B|nr:hypothetical protein [Aquimarina agarivorans]